MKRGKRLSAILLAVLTAMTLLIISTVASFAANSATWSDGQYNFGSVTLNSAKAEYSGSGVEAEVDDQRTEGYVNPDGKVVKISEVFYCEGTPEDYQLQQIQYAIDGSGLPSDGIWTTDAPVNAGAYTAVLNVIGLNSEQSQYEDSWERDQLVVPVTITPKKVTLQWTVKKMTYDGKNQFPTVKFNGLVNSSDAEAVVYEEKTAPEGDKSFKDAGAHTVTAGVMTETGYVKLEAGQPLGDDTNYILDPDEVVTKEYSIDPMKIEIGWARPVYDEYGYTKYDPKKPDDKDLVIVEDDQDMNLVFNGLKQAPVPVITNKVDGDTVKLTLENYNSNIEVDDYSVAVTGVDGKDYKNYELTVRRARSYSIVPHPAWLKWLINEGQTYNGKEQKTAQAEVMNLQADRDGKLYECEVTECVYSDGIDFSGDKVKRQCVDAGIYTVEATKLSNRNYTLYQYDNEAGALSEKFVESYKTDNYIIDQLRTRLTWANNPVTYNASEQKPTATVSNLQSDEKGKKDAVPVTVTIIDADGNVSYAVDAGKYSANGCIENGDLYRNYTLGADRNVWDAKINNFVINKKALTVKVNDSKIRYRDKAVFKGYTYSGLVNGKGANANTDMNADGSPTDTVFIDTSIGKPVPLKDAIVYSFGKYFANAKPGKYPITAALAKGVTAKNYNVAFVNGTLTVADKKTTLVAKGTKKGSKAIKLSWKKVTGAKSYDVYFSICNTDEKKFVPKKIKTVKGTTYTVKKFKGKKLLKNTSYKYYVVAKDANGNVIAKSKEGHCITGGYNDMYTNAKSMSTNKKSLTIRKGSTAVLSAKYVKVKNNRTLHNHDHSPLTRFVSENKKVATVDKKGNVLGVGKGWCRIYVIGTSGAWKAVEVTVK